MENQEENPQGPVTVERVNEKIDELFELEKNEKPKGWGRLIREIFENGLDYRSGNPFKRIVEHLEEKEKEEKKKKRALRYERYKRFMSSAKWGCGKSRMNHFGCQQNTHFNRKVKV